MKLSISGCSLGYLIYEFFVVLLILVVTANPVLALDIRALSIRGVPEEGATISFGLKNKSSRYQYIWDLDGDGKFEIKARNPKKRVLDNGLLRIAVKRVLKKKSSRQASIRRNFSIKNVTPTVRLISATNLFLNSEADFTAIVTDAGELDMAAGFLMQWDFGDGTSQSGKNLFTVNHSYSAVGAYQISVSATDKDGAISRRTSAILEVREIGRPSPTATPSASPTNSPPNPQQTVVRPRELVDQIISNPGMGWQSGDRVNASGFDSQGLPNKIAYIKYYWRNLETSPGVFNWNTFDQRLLQARNAGQKIAFRIVVVDNLVSAPDWLRNLGVAGTWFQYLGDGPDSPVVWTPNYDDVVFAQRHAQFLQVLGQRYNNHPDIDSIDIGSVGLWGEWHFGETRPVPPLPSQAAGHAIIDQYFRAFPSIPKIAQLEQLEPLSYAIQRGAGFRGDCLGNVQWQNRVSPPGMYEQRIQAAAAQDTWRTAPVHFETCWTIAYWVTQGWSVDTIFNWALSKHVTAINNKNAAVPESALPKVRNLLKRIGYRFVLRELRHTSRVAPGQRFSLEMDWENVGVAPPYTDQRLAVRMTNAVGTVVSLQITSNSAKNWAPGVFSLDQSVETPANLPPGNYSLSVGLVNPATGIPTIQLASEGRDSSGWYQISSIQVE